MRLFLIISLLLLTSCATTNFEDSDTLKPNEGIVAFTFDCEDYDNLTFYPKGTIFDGSYKERLYKRSAGVSCKNFDKTDVKLVKMGAGDHFLGMYSSRLSLERKSTKYMVNSHVPEDRAYKFHIAPQTVNYIGNFETSGKPNVPSIFGAQSFDTPTFKNDYESFVQKMSPKNRAVIQKYTVVKAIVER